MKLLVPFALLALAAALAFSLDRPLPRAEFTFINRDEVFTLDPQRMSWMQDFRLAYALYEPLVRWNPADFSVIPAACEAMPAVTDDGLTYTFRLRADARWSDGAPVTAHDYIYAWRRALLPDSAADYSMMFFHIRGAKAFFDHRAADLRALAESSVSDAETMWHEAEQRFERDVGLEAIDDRTLRVTLERPVPYFLDLVAFGPFHPVYRPCVEGWELNEADASRARERGWHAIMPPPLERRRFIRVNPVSGILEQSHEWTKPEHLVTNGPYVLTDWRYRRGMRLELNPCYHSPGMVKSHAVDIVSIAEPNTAVLAFERGQIDWLSDVDVEYQADLVAERVAYERRHRAALEAALSNGLSMDEALASLPLPERGERRDIHSIPTFGVDFFSFNCRPTLNDGRANPFFHPAVRRAFVLAVDRDALVSKVTRLHEPIATALTPRGSIPDYHTPEGLNVDVARAREELHAAGWIDRDGDGVVEDERGMPFPVIDLLYSTNTPRYRNLALALRDMWQRELSVRIELRGKENKARKEDLRAGNFMIGSGQWYGDYGDPTTFLDICKTGDGNNDRGYSSRRVDDLLALAAAETDADARLALLAECERYLFQEDPPMLVVCNLVQLMMYDPARVRGISHHPRLSQYVWQVEAAAAGQRD